MEEFSFCTCSAGEDFTSGRMRWKWVKKRRKRMKRRLKRRAGEL
ncbi:MAG TPA: hypothetical protein VGQ00_00565 [Candidatus Norongarragalinales archaeon]|nr:hypothetical protein [Candidatus Norongarragalinales archaeon]